MKKLTDTLESSRLPDGIQRFAKMIVEEPKQKTSNKVSIITAAAGAGIDIVSATRDERGYLSELAKEYRPEIAKANGAAEHQITEADYHKAFAENPILAQAKKAVQMSGGVRFVNTTVALGVGILAGIGSSALIRQAQAGGRQDADASNIGGGTIATLAAAGAGKLMRNLLHTRKQEGALENTAHHKIMLIKSKQQHGEETTAADIFQVQLALNDDVQDAIRQKTGQRFQDMEPERQLELLKTEFPAVYEANTEMARLINEEGLRPQQLLFGEIRAPEKPQPDTDPLAPGHPDLPPNAAGQGAQAIEASGATAAGKVLLDELNRGDVGDEEKEASPEKDEGERSRQAPDPERPPVTPRSETPLEPQVRTPVGQEGDRERARLALQEGQGGHAARVGRGAPTEGFAGKLDVERASPQEAAYHR